jgi:uncharacterized protein (DUF488 family)
MMDIDKSDEQPLTIYTIGHSNALETEFIGLLRIHEIKALVDVRSQPYSKHWPWFDGESLKRSRSLRDAGIEYHYLGHLLGGRPKESKYYWDKHVPDGEADYLHLVNYPEVMKKDSFKEGIDKLIDIARQKRTAIMCSEEDPAKCHRHHLIGRYLVEEKKIKVLHIRKDGRLVEDQQFPYLDKPPAKQLTLFILNE